MVEKTFISSLYWSKIIELESKPPTLTPSPKKTMFGCSNAYKIEVMIMSLIEMPELSNFGHMTISTI